MQIRKQPRFSLPAPCTEPRSGIPTRSGPSLPPCSPHVCPGPPEVPIACNGPQSPVPVTQLWVVCPATVVACFLPFLRRRGVGRNGGPLLLELFEESWSPKAVLEGDLWAPPRCPRTTG